MVKGEIMSLYNEILKRQTFSNAEHLAVKCDQVEYTYGELDLKIQELASLMKNRGVVKGDKVLVMIENPIEFVMAFFALSFLEAVIIPLYYHTGLQKVEAIVEKYEINHLISDSAQNVMGKREGDITVESHSFYIYGYCKERDIALSNVELILFTSGTTNLPKAIMLSGNNILSNVMAISSYLKVSAEDKILLIKNLSHSSSIVGELLMGMYNGCSVIMTKKLQVGSVILKIMEENQITVFFAVPTILKDIMSNRKLDTYNISQLRIINFYGASMHYQDILKLIDKFPWVNIIYSYGQTEASPRVTYIERDDFLEEPPKKYFRMFPGNEVRLMHAYFVKCTGCEKDENGSVTVVHGTYDPASRGGNSPDGRKVKGTIHWVNAQTAVSAQVRLYENIVDEEKGVYNEDGSLNLNPNSLTVLENCYMEPALKDAAVSESFQFVRQGFFCVDAKDSDGEHTVFNRIVSLKSSFKLPK